VTVIADQLKICLDVINIIKIYKRFLYLLKTKSKTLLNNNVSN